MFKNKILVRSHAPPSTTSSFHLRQLTLSTPSPFSTSLALHIDSLCWSLSRRHRLSCLCQSHHIYVIYLGNQSRSAAEAVEEIVGTLSISHVGEEEEVKCGSVIAKAIGRGLRCVFLEREWRCVGDGYFVDSCFSRDEEKKHLLSFHLTVQPDKNDGFVFIVAPDVVRFTRHKLEDMLSLKLRQQFDCGEEVVVDCDSLLTSCSILPSLVDGHVIGISKSPPSGKHFDRLEELWSFKHGLALQSDFFMNIQITRSGLVNRQWFPSSFVLQSSGLTPAPQTVRSLKSICAFQSFLTAVEAWDFFGGGQLKTKDICRIGIGPDLPLWQKATDNIPSLKNKLDAQESTNDIFSALRRMLLDQGIRFPYSKASFWTSLCQQEVRAGSDSRGLSFSNYGTLR
ncbi:hypothetical protein QJS04_geneDACA019671 [Acorus gramineus]|uniref:Uncharacterized protein n=1 Tax=Acorus gramineus TaxID=55184 RepID=A0AAV9BLF4_ACOGR|nr:hypothetical protein QJS04_geneDACA019671 [Acorus gramineus]